MPGSERVRTSTLQAIKADSNYGMISGRLNKSKQSQPSSTSHYTAFGSSVRAKKMLAVDARGKSQFALEGNTDP